MVVGAIMVDAVVDGLVRANAISAVVSDFDGF